MNFHKKREQSASDYPPSQHILACGVCAVVVFHEPRHSLKYGTHNTIKASLHQGLKNNEGLPADEKMLS